ncbi:MAG: DNA-protecting protein DprA [Candidatus Sungbacteria bacterium]|uniref:DNA-protecting protein DprA n=1 Tax=Candidatus Sungiibacteriota bacterium TaxID=2750080 RepID=A0A931WPF7_9BACT|nr:DNA-protecting protein DprA [Candidatus Sungbacteria bacterium]
MLSARNKKFLHAILLTGAEYDTVQKILETIGSLESAWRATASELESAGVGRERAEAIAGVQKSLDPDDEMRKLVGQMIALVARDDPEFPKELLEIPSPPFTLYIKGRLTTRKPRLAVVGTRKATIYGKQACEKIIHDLADKTDLEIVSGLAQGIDTEAHRHALKNNLKTIGVLGSGIDRQSFFPYENWNLAEEIIRKGGAVISEYPPGTPALKHHFPARNRIISGLALATLVVEAPEKSGALITANFALEQGRDVLAIPGQMFSLNALGVHRLIQSGAKLVTSADDIIDELGLERKSISQKAETLLTDQKEKIILSILAEPQSVDDIKLKAGLTTPEIVSCLTLLELKGFIRPMGQNKFQRVS